MGIGVVLLGSLIFAAVTVCAGILAVWLARRVRRTGLRRVLFVLAIAVAALGPLAFAGNLAMLLWPRETVDPRQALAQIFPAPFSPDVEPTAAMREVSSDWYSLHVVVRLDARGAEWLKRSRNLAARPAPEGKDFRLPTTQEPPEFWPRQSCANVEVYSREDAEADRSRGLRAFDSIYLLYCPSEGAAYVWAADID